jgi:hypothetical protein
MQRISSFILPIRITINPVKTQQCILLFSTTCFGLKGHHDVEHQNKRIYLHSLYGVEISQPQDLYCYAAVRNMGHVYTRNSTVCELLRSRFHINCAYIFFCSCFQPDDGHFGRNM